MHSFDLVVSSVGILSIRGTRDPGLTAPIEDPMKILQKGYSVTIVLAVLTFGVVSQATHYDYITRPTLVSIAFAFFFLFSYHTWAVIHYLDLHLGRL